MPAVQSKPSPGPLSGLRPAIQWLVLLVAAALVTLALDAVHMPAALLLGPMLCAILAGTLGATIRMPAFGFAAAQSVIGCLIAASIQAGIFSIMLADWPLILVGVLSTVAASSLLGWLISRLRILPGTTGVWGSAPGAATAMVLMAEAFGADARLVAFMQYLRVVMVTFAAALVARLWVDTSHVAAPDRLWFPPFDLAGLAGTLVIAVVGAALGRALRIPSPYFLGPMSLGLCLHLGAGVPLALPEWLLAASYACVGCAIGLKFDRAVILRSARVLPQLMVAILLLIGFCGGIAWLLASRLGIDPLTAYLATSPGGMDSVAIIAAASSRVDLSFVMALQTARFLFVLIFGPALSRLVARSLGPT